MSDDETRKRDKAHEKAHDAKEKAHDVKEIAKQPLEEANKNLADDAPEPPKPEPVASDNVGKNPEETTKVDEAAADTSAETGHQSTLLAGPILRYTRQSEDFTLWHGSVLIVLSAPGEPSLSYDYGQGSQDGRPECIWDEKDRHFWRFDMDVKQGDQDAEVRYSIRLPSSGRDEAPPIERSFWVCRAKQTFHILFHSCNGFCDGAENEYVGPTLWKDVLRNHEKKPFHVMVGGGDQIYSDGVTNPGAPLEGWTALPPRKKARIAFTAELRDKVDQWYFTNHCDWFNTTPFREATAQIPSVNIWDDHDIIDGFGSYRDKWQRAPVFVGIGEIAWKWMCLFQQQVNPNTTKDPDPNQPSDREKDDPSYIHEPSFVIHKDTGPYIKHRGISIVSSFGSDVVFAGLDCRTDRTQKRICYASTYDSFFERLEKSVVKGQTKHLLLLLGVPIAYPRLVWAESILNSKAMEAMRVILKPMGLVKGIYNSFDGKAELLDDLQDHWACKEHKRERASLVLRLQAFASLKQVRITILSGDVHLAAVGRFFSKKELMVPQERDHRYMVNIISSAITNAPPPPTVAQVLNQRNKLHHLDRNTDENLMRVFNVSTDNSSRLNQTTYPARNYCIITQQSETDGPLVAAPHAALGEDKDKIDKNSKDSDAHHKGDDSAHQNGDSEANANHGKDDPVRAKKVRGTAIDADLNMRNVEKEQGVALGRSGAGALSVSLQIEVDHKDREGAWTKSYAFSIPMLEADGGKEKAVA